MEQQPKKRYVPNPRLRDRLRKAALDNRLSEHQRERARARLRDIATLESASMEFDHAAPQGVDKTPSEIMPFLIYGLAPSIIFCTLGVLVPAAIIFGDAAWEWLTQDRIMAIVVFERGIMRADPASETIFGGIAIGLLVSIGILIYRWVNGYWPHQ